MVSFIDEQRDEFGVGTICEVMGFATSTYFAAKKREREPSRRTVRDQELLVEIRRVYHEKGRGLYGVKKVWRELCREGVDVARCTVERLMRAEGMLGALSQRRRPRTTIAGNERDRPSDLVERDFRAPCPNQLWLADF